MTPPIVCGVDDSDRARAAAEVAAALADHLKLPLLLVHVASWPSIDPQTRRTTMGLEWATSEHRRHNERWLRELASSLTSELSARRSR